jgi:hypothetical protein
MLAAGAAGGKVGPVKVRTAGTHRIVLDAGFSTLSAVVTVTR